MRVSVNKNFVETDTKIYEFASAAHAESFINCLIVEGEVYCSLLAMPVRIRSKPRLLPHSVWSRMHRFSRSISARFA